MESARVQKLGEETVLEITRTETVKERISEKDLLRQRTYFQEMVAKGQAGLARVDDQLTQIQNGNGTSR